jgi:hypothetical protein
VHGHRDSSLAGLALFTTLFCSQNTVQLTTASMVRVNNLTPPGSDNPTPWRVSGSAGALGGAEMRSVARHLSARAGRVGTFHVYLQ